jgi:hypothetical protein
MSQPVDTTALASRLAQIEHAVDRIADVIEAIASQNDYGDHHSPTPATDDRGTIALLLIV